MREYIQAKLEEIKDIESGEIVQEDIVELGKTYFGYQVKQNYQDRDRDGNCTYRVSLIGFVIRKNIATENTLDIIEKATREIVNALKELNIKSSFEDATITNNTRKIKINGNCYYNEINNKVVF